MHTTTEAANSLAGVRVFVAEDEFPVLQMIEDMLEDLGCRVAASVTSVPAALEAADTADADVAVLDLNLRGHSAFPVAAVLKRRGIPILFSTGYGSAGLESEWRHCQVIQKPFPIERLGAAIAEVMRKSC